MVVSSECWGLTSLLSDVMVSLLLFLFSSLRLVSSLLLISFSALIKTAFISLCSSSVNRIVTTSSFSFSPISGISFSCGVITSGVGSVTVLNIETRYTVPKIAATEAAINQGEE